MSFFAYPDYKSFGVELFKEVPSSWSIQRLKQVISPMRPITYGIVQAGENVPDGIPYIRPADMTDESGVKAEDTLLRTSPEVANSYKRSSIVAGDIVCSIGPSFGKLMMVPSSLEGSNLTQGTARVAVSQDHIPRFIFWVLRSVESYQQWESSVGGATFRALNLGPLAETFICVPSPAEQAQIARFLDHETVRIDALIEEQQRLIELLKEKRQAVISHAVTKGLDPTVLMKDSGVEWLGEVPAHWGVKSMKHLVEDGESVSYGIVQPGDHQDEGVPFIQTTNMSSGDFSFDALQRTSSEIEANYPRSRLHGGEVILGIRATIGAAFMVPESLKNINLSRGVARIACSEQVLAGYLVYFLSGRAAFEYWGLAKQGSTFSEVSIATVRELPVTVPPLIEQQELIEHIEQGIKSLDDLTLIGERTMALLRERRSALISAAVTGKIDVRGWQPPASAPTPELVEEAV